MAYKLTHSAQGFLQQKESELAETLKKEKQLQGYQLQVQKNKAEGIAQSIKGMKEIEQKRKGLLSYGV
jgi:hypothetical protein